jgi:hypothetical protein
MAKVVINKCFGGFSISYEAAKFMAERGSTEALKDIQDYEKRIAKPDPRYPTSSTTWFGYGGPCGYDRTDPNLIAAVETLKEKANGLLASLRVIEIPDGIEYEIDEYDGMESIAEKHRSWG